MTPHGTLESEACGVLIYDCQGVFHNFLKKFRGRERPHWDLNPFPLWLAEVYLSLPLTIIIIADYFKNASGKNAQILGCQG